MLKSTTTPSSGWLGKDEQAEILEIIVIFVCDNNGGPWVHDQLLHACGIIDVAIIQIDQLLFKHFKLGSYFFADK